MKILVAEKLSEHRYKTPEGYLICVDSILARTGKQTYKRSEIFGDDDERLVEVDRKAEEVFSPETMASFENKPICVEHPDVDVNSGNISEFAVGFVRDIHKGEYEGEPVMLGTLVITDAKTVEEIEEGKHTDLSCGYDCDIDDSENPQQRNIRGNHVALCEQGRAGIARIMDSVKDEESTYTEVTKKLEKEAKKDISWLDAVVNDSKRITDFDDTPRNVRVVKEFIVNNGNKFSKSKDADKILDYIKMKTGIRNVDYGDVMYIIKNYTGAEITDSVKDAKFEICYIDNGDVCVAIEAKDENDARQKFHRRYGMYYIKHIRKVKDGVKDMTNISDRLIEIPEDYLRRFEEQLKMRKIHVVSRGRTMMGRIHYQVEFGGPARQLAKLLNELDGIMDRQNIPMTYSAGDNDNDYSTAGIDLDKMYVKDMKHDAADLSGLYKNDGGDVIKVTRRGFSYDVQFGEDTISNTGWSYPRSYDSDHLQRYLRQNRLTKVSRLDYLKDSVKDMKVSRDNIREQPVFVMQSDVDKNLFFYIGKTHAMKEGEYTYAQYDMEGMTPDKLRKELEANGWHKVARGPAPFIDETTEEIKDYVPFPTKNGLTRINITKEQALSYIAMALKEKENTVEDSEGVIYLTQKAYNHIKAMVKNYGITQKELEGISKYFFGPGGYNMFK